MFWLRKPYQWGRAQLIQKIPQVRVLGRSKFYNNMVTQKEMLEYRSAWKKMNSSRDHRYNTADPSTDHQEGASLIKYKPALLKPKIN